MFKEVVSCTVDRYGQREISENQFLYRFTAQFFEGDNFFGNNMFCRKGARAAYRSEVNAPVFLAGFANGVVPFPFSDGRQNSMIVKFRCETIHP